MINPSAGQPYSAIHVAKSCPASWIECLGLKAYHVLEGDSEYYKISRELSSDSLKLIRRDGCPLSFMSPVRNVVLGGQTFPAWPFVDLYVFIYSIA